jgi:hypothetical protein
LHSVLNTLLKKKIDLATIINIVLVLIVQIAVKKLKAMNSKAEMEFAVEVEVLGRVRHKNLLGLRGYCAGTDQRLIVYDYMPNLSLLSHLHGQFTGEMQMDWKRRMKIAIGSAEGLL